MRIIGTILVLYFGLLTSLHANTLTEKKIEKWLHLAPKMQALFNQHHTTLSSFSLDFKQGAPTEIGQKAKHYLEQANLLPTFEAALNKQFTVAEYITVQTQIIQALMEQAQAQIPNQVERQFAENMLDLEDVEGLTSEQKAMLRQQMESLFHVTNKQKTNTSANAKLVAKYQAQIQRVLAQTE